MVSIKIKHGHLHAKAKVKESVAQTQAPRGRTQRSNPSRTPNMPNRDTSIPGEGGKGEPPPPPRFRLIPSFFSSLPPSCLTRLSLVRPHHPHHPVPAL